MKKRSFRMPLIIILLMISILQVMRLWFGDVSNRNFFYSFIQFNQESYGEILSDDTPILNPSTMAIYYPQQERFAYIKKTRAEFEDLLLANRRMLQNIIWNGYNEGIALVNWDDFWLRRSIIIKLPFDMTYDMLLQDTYIIKNEKEQDYLFNYIVTIPSNEMNGKMVVYLVNAEQGQAMKISLENSKEMGYNQQLLSMIDVIFSKQSFPTYVGTKKLGLRMFNQNVFLPVEDVNVYYNQSIQLKRPFYEEGTIDEKAMENYVNRFFTNPASKFLVRDNDTWTFRDQRTVVKYHNQGVVEFTDLTTTNQRVDMNFAESYRLAIRFLEEDLKVYNQEYYLQDYEINSKDTVFLFNYRFNDFDYELSDAVKESLNIQAPIEIRVSGGHIAYYKRWITNKEINLFDYQEVDINYIMTLDRFYEIYSSDELTSIDNMYLAYYIDHIEEEARLNWIIQAENKYVLHLK